MPTASQHVKSPLSPNFFHCPWVPRPWRGSERSPGKSAKSPGDGLETRGEWGTESSTLIDRRGNTSQAVKKHKSQNTDLQLGFMSKIRANSWPGTASHLDLGLWRPKPSTWGRGSASLMVGPSARVAGVAFIPGCHGAGKAAVGGSGGPCDRTLVFCFWEQTRSSWSSSGCGGRLGHGAGPASTGLEAKIQHTCELNMFHRGSGTTSGEVLKGKDLSCTPLLRLKSPSDSTEHGRSKSDEAPLHLVHARR